MEGNTIDDPGSESEMSVIRMLHVSKIYKDNRMALSDITLNINKGDFVYITGPSGAGKTTLLKLIFCEEKPTGGEIFVAGMNIAAIKKSKIPYLRRKMGMIFQDFKLLNDRTVFENIAIAGEVIGLSKKEVQRKAWKVLSLVGLHGKSNLLPLRLSMGEQQRVALARAIVNSPIILLADEPTANLDPETSAEVMNLLGRINARGTTVVVATNSPYLVQGDERKVFVLKK